LKRAVEGTGIVEAADELEDLGVALGTGVVTGVDVETGISAGVRTTVGAAVGTDSTVASICAITVA